MLGSTKTSVNDASNYYTIKPESVYEDLQEMLKQNSTPQTMKSKDLYP